MAARATPTLTLAGFRLTVLGYEFPDNLDVWDGNWLQIEAECQGDGILASVAGPFISTDEIAALGEALQSLLDGAAGEPSVDLIEPNLAFGLRRAGESMTLAVSIWPRGEPQSRRFAFDIRPDHVSTAINDCRAILDAYPIRGTTE